MATSKLDEGRYGENYAASFLLHKGYKIIDRNFRIRGGEIDLIAIETAKDGVQTLVFIEVKTRTSNEFGTPLEAIGYYKIKTLLRAAQLYKMTHPGLPELMRIDAVGVVVDKNSQLLEIDLVKSIT